MKTPTTGKTAFFPVVIKIILVLGGLYLAYEGAEKIVEFLFHRPKKGHRVSEHAKDDNRDVEKTKVKSAITTDFILSVEIVIIALGTVIEEKFVIQILTVSVVAMLATAGVYGLVALIIRMDDIGFRLIKRSQGKGAWFALGNVLVKSLPWVIKSFAIIGTIALLLVSGGIFIHNFTYLHHSFPQVPLILKEFMIGLVAGLIVVGIVSGVKKIFGWK